MPSRVRHLRVPVGFGKQVDIAASIAGSSCGFRVRKLCGMDGVAIELLWQPVLCSARVLLERMWRKGKQLSRNSCGWKET